MLRIRQIVFAARDLAATVSQFETNLGLRVVYRDPQVAQFGLQNAMLAIGDQFLEVVSPTGADSAAARHLARHGDSAYMLILQTDQLARDRARLDRLGVRVIWQAQHPDMLALHLHPKDVGAAIVSLDQPSPPASWRWAGPDWKASAVRDERSQIVEATVGAVDPDALARRWAEVLGTAAPADGSIALAQGALRFVQAAVDLIVGFRLVLPLAPQSLTLCGTRLRLG